VQLVKKILIVVHQPTSDTGLVGQILRAWGYTLDIRVMSQQGSELPPTMDNHEAVIIFGGPMSANDRETLPFIGTELDWIPVALESGKPYLGICLGAQLLARVLGATVQPHPDGMVELPKGAVSLFKGEVFKNQAFRYGENAYGVQFHPEMTREMMERWTTEGAHMLTLPGAQSRDEHLYQHSLYAIAMENWLKGFLCHWLGQDAITQKVCA
jgi:GMP synthase (glutamine-hydrolysing)